MTVLVAINTIENAKPKTVALYDILLNKNKKISIANIIYAKYSNIPNITLIFDIK